MNFVCMQIKSANDFQFSVTAHFMEIAGFSSLIYANVPSAHKAAMTCIISSWMSLILYVIRFNTTVPLLCLLSVALSDITR